MEPTLKEWILLAALGVTATALGFIIKVATNSLIRKLDGIVSELKQLNLNSTMHTQEIRNIQEGALQMNQRINNHAERLRTLEISVKPAKHEQNEI